MRFGRLFCRFDRHRVEIRRDQHTSPDGLFMRCVDCATRWVVVAPEYRGACAAISFAGLGCQLQFGHDGGHYHGSVGVWRTISDVIEAP
jgi:hypothetical protein